MKNEKVNLYSKIVDMEYPKVTLSKVDLSYCCLRKKCLILVCLFVLSSSL